MINSETPIKIEDMELNAERVCAMEMEWVDGGTGRTFLSFKIVGLESGRCLIDDIQFEFLDKELEATKADDGSVTFTCACRDDSVFLTSVPAGKEFQAINPR